MIYDHQEATCYPNTTGTLCLFRCSFADVWLWFAHAHTRYLVYLYTNTTHTIINPLLIINEYHVNKKITNQKRSSIYACCASTCNSSQKKTHRIHTLYYITCQTHILVILVLHYYSYYNVRYDVSTLNTQQDPPTQ